MRRITILALFAAGFLLICGAGASYAQPAPITSQYAVKFVCGTQRPIPGLTAPAEPPVKPGNYATVINIEGLASVDTGQNVPWLVSVAGQPNPFPGSTLSVKRFQTGDITCADIASATSTLSTKGFITGYVNLVTTGGPIVVTAVYTSQGCVFPLNTIAVIPPACGGAVSTDVVPQQPVATSTPG